MRNGGPLGAGASRPQRAAGRRLSAREGHVLTRGCVSLRVGCPQRVAGPPLSVRAGRPRSRESGLRKVPPASLPREGVTHAG